MALVSEWLMSHRQSLTNVECGGPYPYIATAVNSTAKNKDITHAVCSYVRF